MNGDIRKNWEYFVRRLISVIFWLVVYYYGIELIRERKLFEERVKYKIREIFKLNGFF